MENLEIVITAREKDLGGFSVRRVLPYEHCMIGPFIFFDHMGPAAFAAGHGIDVRPHPHINLATVTYLFEGKIRHQDSLGSDQLIEPGAINWMVAGHGIVHSERTPEDLHREGSKLNGIQCWIALPDEYEEMPPSFTHHPKETLPEFVIDEVKLKLLLGKAFSRTSPVKIYSDMFYVYADFPRNTELTFPTGDNECAAYVVSGKVRINDQEIDHCAMAVAKTKKPLYIEAIEDSKVMLLGGKSVGQRYIYWNFVSSSQEKIEQAKVEWANGPGKAGSRFPLISGDAQEFIPLPNEDSSTLSPKGTIM
ncbi:MAG: pirin family protein [Gammaproteobacteria bacterium]|nr:pirin family protein [Gammaproteobacteria bacterium]